MPRRCLLLLVGVMMMLIGCATTSQDRAFQIGVASYEIALAAMNTLIDLRDTCHNAEAMRTDPTLVCESYITEAQYQQGRQAYERLRILHNTYLMLMKTDATEAVDLQHRQADLMAQTLAFHELVTTWGGKTYGH